MKRLRKSRGFLLGLAMGLFISAITFTANAESITKQLTAYYNNIKLVVNGNEVIPKDGNGKMVEPFIVDGTTYLPVRAVAEALGQAVSWDGKANTVYIGENKTTGQPKGSRLTMPPMTQEDAINEDNVQVFTERELRKINHVMERSNCHTAFMLGYHLGLRIGECFALMWKDIDWEAGTITINKQMQYEEGCFCLVPVKTLRSVRTIEMGETLNNYLFNAFVKQSNQRLALKDGYRDTELVLDKTKNGKPIKIFGGDFINRKENGKLLTINSIKYWSSAIKKETEIDFHYHSLRKTHATMMANLNTPVLELMNRLGHKKFETTMAYYINSNQLAKATLKQNLNSLDFIREDMHSQDVLLELLDVFDEQEEVFKQTPQWIGEDMAGRLKINVSSLQGATMESI